MGEDEAGEQGQRLDSSTGLQASRPLPLGERDERQAALRYRVGKDVKDRTDWMDLNNLPIDDASGRVCRAQKRQPLLGKEQL
jgi:hypothetical protein